MTSLETFVPRFNMREICNKLYLGVVTGIKKRQLDLASKKDKDQKAREHLFEQAAQVNPKYMLKSMVLQIVAEYKGKAKGGKGKGKAGKLRHQVA